MKKEFFPKLLCHTSRGILLSSLASAACIQLSSSVKAQEQALPEALVNEETIPDFCPSSQTAVTSAVSPLEASSGTSTPDTIVSVIVDRCTRYQTIDGFGFFGGPDNWWNEWSREYWANVSWAEMALKDLGATLWRNEYASEEYEPGMWTDEQQWVVKTLHDVAVKEGIDLKFIFSVWSPPPVMKCQEKNQEPIEGKPHPQQLNEGGALCRSQSENFAQWLIQGIQRYKDLGIDLYALSFQNEPSFVEPYSSAVYSPTYYAETLARIGPIVKQTFPQIKFYGSEHMLQHESLASNWEPKYVPTLLQQPNALSFLDIWAVHGYPYLEITTPASLSAQLWSGYYESVAATGKPVWMTETSGYINSWEGDSTSAGAFNLGQQIYSALRYGKVSGWLWWQYSQNHNEDSRFVIITSAAKPGKKYFVSKNFYRYIRPGAVMVEAKTKSETIQVVAFDHLQDDTFVMVALNPGNQAQTISISGQEIPESLQIACITSAVQDCAAGGSASRSAIELPPRSVVTLTSGEIPLGHPQTTSSAPAVPVSATSAELPSW